MTGIIFGYLTVLRRAGTVKKQAAWECLCKCGTVKILIGSQLRCGAIKSCGCLRAEKNISRSTHGHSGRNENNPTYNTWASMVQRCTNSKHPAFERYGGRGITACERWLKFENFLADMGERPSGTSLDRWPNNDGNYEKSNCRWATSTEQGRNKRNNVMLTYLGDTLSMPDMCEKYGLSRDIVKGRLTRGWTVEKSLSTPNPKQTLRERAGLKIL